MAVENGRKFNVFENADVTTATLSLSQSLLSSVSVWAAKQFENDDVDKKHFIRFRDENTLLKFIRLRLRPHKGYVYTCNLFSADWPFVHTKTVFSVTENGTF